MYGTWEENIKDFKEGMKVIGIARETEKSKNCIFIELKPNLIGLAEYKEDTVGFCFLCCIFLSNCSEIS